MVRRNDWGPLADGVSKQDAKTRPGQVKLVLKLPSASVPLFGADRYYRAAPIKRAKRKKWNDGA